MQNTWEMRIAQKTCASGQIGKHLKAGFQNLEKAGLRKEILLVAVDDLGDVPNRVGASKVAASIQ